jgi:hypothetical protein
MRSFYGLKVEEFTQPSEFTLTYCDSRAGQVSSFVLIREFSEVKKQAKKKGLPPGKPLIKAAGIKRILTRHPH